MSINISEEIRNWAQPSYLVFRPIVVKTKNTSWTDELVVSAQNMMRIEEVRFSIYSLSWLIARLSWLLVSSLYVDVHFLFLHCWRKCKLTLKRTFLEKKGPRFSSCSIPHGWNGFASSILTVNKDLTYPCDQKTLPDVCPNLQDFFNS